MSDRTQSQKSLIDLFPNLSSALVSKADMFSVFDKPTRRTPKIDEFYAFPEMQTLECLTILEKPERNNVWLSGWSGSGKSSLIRQMAARLNVNFFEINGHEHMTSSNLFGRWTARRGETVYIDGIVPKWLQEGGWLLINEYSTQDPGTVNALKSCLEFPRSLVLTEDGDRVIYEVGKEPCKLIVTDNTQGRGDDSGMFVNTQVQSSADMRRFNGFVVLDYLEPAQEIAQLLRRMAAPGFPDCDHVSRPVIEAMVKIANQTREGFKKGTLGCVLSTAEVINWAENYALFSTAHHSARISFLNQYTPEAATAVRELINSVFGREDAETLVNADAAKRSADKTGV